jgi:hypothetical protein
MVDTRNYLKKASPPDIRNVKNPLVGTLKDAEKKLPNSHMRKVKNPLK